jgi:hypothetical protein
MSHGLDLDTTIRGRRMSYDKYDRLDGIRSSDIRAILVSPRKYKYLKDNPRPDTDAFRIGRVTHAGILEPLQLPKMCAIWGGKTRRGKAWDEFSEVHKDKTIVTDAQYAAIEGMTAAVHAHPVAGKLLAEGEPERVFRWKERGTTGPICKSMVDWLTKGLHKRKAIVEVKTVRDASPHAFGRAALALGYHVQVAHYLAGYCVAMDDEPPEAYIVAVEKTPPHDVAVYCVDGATLALGRSERAVGLTLLEYCERMQEFGGAWPETMDLELPAWAYSSDDDDEHTITVGGEVMR